MANELGLGALFSGMGQGYDDQSKTQILQSREAREREAHGLAIKNAQLDLEAKQSERDYQNDLKASTTELANLAKPQQITDPATGQVTEKPGMDPIQLQLAAADKLKEVAFKHGKVDLKMLQESRDFGRKIRSEGAIEAMQYAMTNPNDQEGIRKIFNEKGSIKLGDDVQIGMKDGLFGPTVVGYKIGPKGQKTEVFDGFRDIIMPSMSGDAYAAMMGQMKIAEGKAQTDIYTTGMQTGSAERIASNRLQSDRALKLHEWERDDRKFIQSATNSNTANFLRGPGGAMQPERTMQIENEIGATAEALHRQFPQYRNNPSAALADARTAVYKKYNISTEQLGLKK